MKNLISFASFEWGGAANGRLSLIWPECFKVPSPAMIFSVSCVVFGIVSVVSNQINVVGEAKITSQVGPIGHDKSRPDEMR